MRLVGVVRTDPALGHASRRLDLDHVGAEVGEEASAPLALLAGELDHAEIREGAAGRLGSRPARHEEAPDPATASASK